jgi:hypothetical protein
MIRSGFLRSDDASPKRTKEAWMKKASRAPQRGCKPDHLIKIHIDEWLEHGTVRTCFQKSSLTSPTNRSISTKGPELSRLREFEPQYREQIFGVLKTAKPKRTRISPGADLVAV